MLAEGEVANPEAGGARAVANEKPMFGSGFFASRADSPRAGMAGSASNAERTSDKRHQCPLADTEKSTTTNTTRRRAGSGHAAEERERGSKIGTATLRPAHVHGSPPRPAQPREPERQDDDELVGQAEQGISMSRWCSSSDTRFEKGADVDIRQAERDEDRDLGEGLASDEEKARSISASTGGAPGTLEQGGDETGENPCSDMGEGGQAIDHTRQDEREYW